MPSLLKRFMSHNTLSSSALSTISSAGSRGESADNDANTLTSNEKRFLAELPQPPVSRYQRSQSSEDDPRQLSFGTTCTGYSSSFETCLNDAVVFGDKDPNDGSSSILDHVSVSEERYPLVVTTERPTTAPERIMLRRSERRPETMTVTTKNDPTIAATKDSSFSPVRRRRSRGTSKLMSHIEHRRWREAEERARSHPEEVRAWATVRTRPRDPTTDDDRDVGDEKRVTKVLRLPLHHACLKSRNVEPSDKTVADCLVTLIETYPEAASVREDRHGCLPLHLFVLFCGPRASVRVLEALLDAHPAGVRAGSEGGRLPLHVACSSRASHEVVSRLLTAYPAAARQRTTDGSNLPLHCLAEAGPDCPETPASLLRVYPDAAAGLNRFGRTPCEEALRAAGERGREHQEELLRVLRRDPRYWFTETLSRNLDETDPGPADADADDRSDDGAADLTALVRRSRWAEVSRRVAEHPAEATEWTTLASRSGRTCRCSPLHQLCERDPPLDVVRAVVDAHPAALSEPSVPAQQSPLHAACTWGAGRDVVRYLVERDPRAASTKDGNGNTPLHAACYAAAETGVVEDLVAAWPVGVWMTNGAGVTALDVVRGLGRGTGETAKLLSREMERTTATTPSSDAKGGTGDGGGAEWV